MEPYEIGERNDRGEALLDFANTDSLTVGNTVLKYHLYLHTFISPGNRYKNQNRLRSDQLKMETIVKRRKNLSGSRLSEFNILKIEFKIKLANPKKVPNIDPFV